MPPTAEGTWLHVRAVPPFSKQDLIDYFATHTGIVLTEAHIDTRSYGDAIIAFDKSALSKLLSWVLDGHLLNGQPLVVKEPWAGRQSGPRDGRANEYRDDSEPRRSDGTRRGQRRNNGPGVLTPRF